MNLSDLKRFKVETDVHPTGALNVTLFVLGDERMSAGTQKQLDVVGVVADGKNEEEATKNGQEFAVEVLGGLKGKADVVRVGTRDLMGSSDKGFTAKVQVGLFDKGGVDEADLIKKVGNGFGKGKTMKAAQEEAIASALRLMGEE